MRIVLIGQAAFGAKVLEALLERHEKVVGIYSPPDTRSGRHDPLKETALSKGISCFQPMTYKDDRTFNEYKKLKPDLTVMAFVTDIIPAHFFEVPHYGAINYHPSLLPRHRGASAINWAVIMGDQRTGISIYWPDRGIDTGPILVQEGIDIDPEDTTGSLYFNHLFPMGIEAIVKSISLIKEGNAQKIPQDEADATYEPPCDDRAAGIDWKMPGQQIYNLIRGCDPQPGGHLCVKGEKIRFYGAKLIVEPDEKAPGTILHGNEKGIHVAVSGGRLILSRCKTDQGGKMPARDLVSEGRLRIGGRLGVLG